MNKLNTFRKIFELYSTGNSWLDNVPREINASVFDNPYVESLQRSVDLLLQSVFTKEEDEWIAWFLYEWYADRSLTVIVKDVEYRFDSFDCFADFLVNEEDWSEE